MTQTPDYKALIDEIEDALRGSLKQAGLVMASRSTLILSALRRAEEMDDRIEGLTADLFNAVETAHGRGATEWARLNYSKWIERIEANAAARSALKGTST